MVVVGFLTGHRNVIQMGKTLSPSDILKYSSGWKAESLLNKVSRMAAARVCRFDVDKAYVVLGMRLFPDDVLMSIDYEAPVEEVYIEFAFKYLGNNDTKVLHVTALRWIDTKSYDPKTRQRNPPPTLPSWVPDWRRGSVMNTLSEYNFQAATNTRPSFSLDRKTLAVIGVGGTLVGSAKNDILTFFKGIGGKGVPVNMRYVWLEHVLGLRDR